jgi:hypothetical protein
MAISIKAVQQGAAGNGIQVKLVNNGLPNQPLSISVVGRVISVQLATNAGGSPLGAPQNLDTAIISLINSTPAAAALVVASLKGASVAMNIIESTTTSGGTTSQDILYVRFQWPNGRYTSNIRVDHTVCFAPFKDFGPSLTSNSGIQLPRPIRIEPVLCLPGTEIGIELENRTALAQSAFAAMIEFRGRLRRFLKS